MASLKLSSKGLETIEKRLAELNFTKADLKFAELVRKHVVSKTNGNGSVDSVPGCSNSTIYRFLRGEAIRNNIFEACCEVLGIKVDEVKKKGEVSLTGEEEASQMIDLGRASEVGNFQGREKELENLKKWVIEDGCPLIHISGIGGIGKSSLIRTFIDNIASQEETEFEYIIWRSLRDKLSLEKLLEALIKFLSDDGETELASTTGGLTTQLLECLKQRRCLLILDDGESILESRSQSYREGYEEYQVFLESIAKNQHQSCVLLISRIKFEDVENMEGLYRVRSLELSGLDTTVGKATVEGIAQTYDVKLQGTESEWDQLISSYDGNPLALGLITRHILKRYGGNLAEFLECGLTIFGNIRKIFNETFERLNPAEQNIMYSLAINQRPVSLTELKQDLVSSQEQRNLTETLSTLERQIPIINNNNSYTLHPLLIEYTIERLRENIVQELSSGELQLFNSLALIKATAPDYIKENQIRLIIQPIIDLLNQESLEQHNCLENRLNRLRSSFNSQADGYMAGNSINLMRYAGINLKESDFSGMTIWQADLQDIDLYRVNFAYCKFDKCSCTQLIDDPHAIAFHPKQNLIAIANRINGIGLYRIEDQQLHLHLDKSEDTYELVFSPDGKFIVGISEKRTVKVWSTDTGECRYRFTNGQEIQSIAFAPDNQTIAITSQAAIVLTDETYSNSRKDHIITLWNIRTDEYRIIKTECWDIIILVTFHSQKNLLFGIVTPPIQLSMWNTDAEKRVYIHDLKYIVALDFHPSEEILATIDCHGTIKLWDVNKRKCLKTFENNTEELSLVRLPHFISFSGDGHTIVTVYQNGTIKIWDVKTGKCFQTWSNNENFICTTAFSPQNNILAISYGSKVLKLLNVKTEKWLRTWQFHSSDIKEISISSDGQYLACQSKENTIRLLNLKFERLSTWRLNHVIYRSKGLFGERRELYFSPDCQTLAIFSENTFIKLFDVKTGQEQKTFKHLLSIDSNFRTPKMKFSPDSNLLGRYSLNSSEIIVLDLRNKKMLRSIDTKINSEMDHISTRRILFSQNNQYLANLSQSTKFEGVYSREDSFPIVTSIIQIWDIGTGECCYEHDFANVFDVYEFYLMAFHPNNPELVCHDRSKNEIVFLNFQTGEFTPTLKVHEAEVRGVFFDSEANTYIVTTTNRTIEIWKVGTNEPIQVSESHESDIKGVDFTPDGRILVSYDIDNNIYLWNRETENLERGRLKMPCQGMNITGATGLTPAQKATFIALGAID